MRLFLLVILLCGTVQSWGKDYKGQILVETKILKEKNDSLHMSLEIHIQAAAVKQCQALLLTPILQSGEHSKWFPYIQINGQNRRKMLKRWETLRGKNQVYERPYLLKNVLKNNQEVLVYQMEVPYAPWMDEATFSVCMEIWDCAGEKRLYTLATHSHVELEPKDPYIPVPQVNYILPSAEPKYRNLQGQAFLDFQVGKSVLIPHFRRNPEELAKIAGTIQDIKNNPDITLTGLYIEGYASPEGSYALNERLSLERAEALSEYIQSNFGISKDRIKVSSGAEDWDGLRTLVEENNNVQKPRILEIIDSTIDPDQKEQQLKSLGHSYRILLAEIFPALRRVDYQVDYTVREYTTDEAKDRMDKNPEHLSLRELFLLARSHPEESEPHAHILEITSRLYPDDPVADLNAAAWMLNRGEFLSAKRLLDKVGVNADSYNNWGVYYLLTGALDKARESFLKAKETGLEQAVFNLKEVERKEKDNQKMERYRRK